MIRTLGCEVAREMLPARVDSELLVADQVAVEAHLRWCCTCSAHVEDLRLIGRPLRLRMPRPRHGDDPDLDSLRDDVMSRWGAERAGSWAALGRQAMDDARVLWAGIGATIGVMGCLLLTAGVISATDTRASDSLAAIIDAMGRPGSDENPLQLDGRMAPPRLAMPELFDDSPALNRIPQDDTVFALATVVTREGRVSDFELLLSHYPLTDEEQTSRSPLGDGPVTRADMSRFRDVVSNSRFAPAQAGGASVAVNMVWLLARTTVRGSPRPFDFDEFRPKSKPRPVG